MNIIFFDNHTNINLFPLTLSRPSADLRIGILSIAEKWERILNAQTSFLCSPVLRRKFPLKIESHNILLFGQLLPTLQLVEAIKSLKEGDTLVDEKNEILAKSINEAELASIENGTVNIGENGIVFKGELKKVDRTWKIFYWNDENIRSDFKLLTQGRKSADLSPTNKILGKENLFVEEGATAEFAIFNANYGPIYLGRESEVMENSVIRGPLALLDHSCLKMSSKIYGATTIGPQCKVGGEINNAVFQGYSNKAHDGFLGNAVIGEWCNIGADSNNSNLKNTYEEVRLWNYATQSFEKTGLQFCGLIMGDHSKCGINTMFNTGTVVGFSGNLFGAGFHRNFVPSFAWGGHSGYTTFDIKKAKAIAKAVMQRRNIAFDETESALFDYIFELTKGERNF